MTDNPYEEFVTIHSPLSGDVGRDGITLEVHLYRGKASRRRTD